MKECADICLKEKINCPHKKCRLWIDYKVEQNCTLISIHERGPMTLRQIGERLGISFARVKQLETRALEKLKKRAKAYDLFF